MKPSQKCIDLIKSFEGLRLKAYPDPGSVDGKPITIGYGTTQYLGAGVVKYGRSSVMLGDTLTAEEAEQELQANINRYVKVINGATNKLTQNQFDAAVSFAYNTGPNTRQITRLQSGAIREFRKMMPQYNKGGDGRTMAGLVRRRQAEMDLWDGLTGDGIVKPTWINLVRHDGPEYRAYLMDGGNCLEIKQFRTREDLLRILQDAPTAGNVAVGTEGWHVKPGPTLPEDQQPAKGVATLKSKGFKRDHFLDLELTVGDQKFAVISGQANAQNLRRPQDPRSVPGNMEPIPQGKYSIGDIAWASGKDNYTGSHGPGLGPVWIPLTAEFSDDRGSFGIHLDGGYAGSAGCVVLPNIEELKRFVAALREHDPKILSVEWGL